MPGFKAPKSHLKPGTLLAPVEGMLGVGFVGRLFMLSGELLVCQPQGQVDEIEKFQEAFVLAPKIGDTDRELVAAKLAKALRVQYYQGLLSEFKKMNLSPEIIALARNLKSKMGNDRDLTRSAVQKMVQILEKHPKFAGPEGYQRIQDLLLILTVNLEFNQEDHISPFNCAGARSTFINRARPGGVSKAVYCDISYEYCPNPYEQLLLKRNNNWMDESVAGVTLAGALVRDSIQSQMKLSAAQVMLARKWRMKKQYAKAKDPDLYERVLKLSPDELKLALLSEVWGSKLAAEKIAQENDPKVRAELDQAMRDLLAEDVFDFDYQFSAWDPTNRNLTRLMALSHPEGVELFPLENKSLDLTVDMVARIDSGLIRVTSSKQGVEHPEIDGFQKAVNYYSPDGMKKGKTPPWLPDYYEVRYPKIFELDRTVDGQERMSVKEPPRESLRDSKQIKVYRSKTAKEKKTGKRED